MGMDDDRDSPDHDRNSTSLSKKNKKKPKRKASSIYEEETIMDKRERETTQFARRVNQ